MKGFDSNYLGRRAFLKNGSLLLGAVGLEVFLPNELLADEKRAADELRVGLVTDLHYADKPSYGNRHYRESLDKLAEAAKEFQRSQTNFVVELGDLIDSGSSAQTELQYLQRINKDYAAVAKDRHYVLGNHCVYSLTKDEFLQGVERERTYYSFDRQGMHFVVLDGCFRSDGVPYGRKNSDWTDAKIPAEQIDWLQSDLSHACEKVIVLVHQRLDVANHYGIKNAAVVRQILEDSGKVLAVVQGHNHKNDYNDINGIHYVTLMAMVEGGGAEHNCYSVMNVLPNGTIRVTGFRKQTSYLWEHA
ncbi:MAG TPA: metallophosphoesterase [Lacipirellulaceae bacterium]|jgi:alkaline phosphatase|nr:metallophosphoesterase [Lacipirellulaceae bacterium]